MQQLAETLPLMETSEYAALFQEESRHWWYAGLHDLVVNLVKFEADQWAEPLQILDAGCGTGRLCELMQAHGKVTGCDIHPFALEKAKRRGLDSVFECNLATDDLAFRQYHLITSMDVLSHEAIHDEIAVLHKFHRALKPGGCLYMNIPAFPCLRGSHDLAVHTRRRYRRGELIRLLHRAGFRVELATYRLLPFFFPMLIVRFASRLRIVLGNERTFRSDVLWSGATGINHALSAVVAFENRLLRSGIALPFGTSLFVTARKSECLESQSK